jgi:hypothetical protein
VLGSLGPLVASLKSIAAVLTFRSSDQRLISRDAADRDNCFAAARAGRRSPVGPSGARTKASLLREIARSESRYEPSDQWIKSGREPNGQWIKHGKLRIEKGMSQPSGREGFVPQAQREQYDAQEGHPYAPDEADRNSVSPGLILGKKHRFES